MKLLLLSLVVIGSACGGVDDARSPMSDFADCMLGPDQTTPCHRWLEWAWTDLDEDGDVDLADFAELQNAWGDIGPATLP